MDLAIHSCAISAEGFHLHLGSIVYIVLRATMLNILLILFYSNAHCHFCIVSCLLYFVYLLCVHYAFLSFVSGSTAPLFLTCLCAQMANKHSLFLKSPII